MIKQSTLNKILPEMEIVIWLKITYGEIDDSPKRKTK